MSEVVLKFSAFSSHLYSYKYPTGYTKEEWDELTDQEKNIICSEAIWEDVGCWEEVVDD